ncbi:hypothetical protein E5676_scaffold455G003270 [Cucumis melo var. makuwa]|uniref:Uncharacterized protein n=1 Tax=Cucumis melo var. makuwa TaxID=1194695 RepID=A0A5D3E4Q5_CUCMM|nr:hypothetical protein E5676_scaffold455G003270 [Cucumis melo var. makuwa]
MVIEVFIGVIVRFRNWPSKNIVKTLQEEGDLPSQRYVGRSQRCVGKGYTDAEMDVGKDIVRQAS